MKKFFILMAVLFGSLMSIHAQQSYVATLQHDGNFTYYYGETALTNAYTAAVDGDTITLSAGSFKYSDDFKKGVSLRGTGIEATNKTYIIGDVKFASVDSTSVSTIEGIIFSTKCYIYNNDYGNGQGAIKFIKNWFTLGLEAYKGASFSSIKGPKVNIYNSLIDNRMSFQNQNSTMPFDFNFYNCWIVNPYMGGSYLNDQLPQFINCVITFNNKITQASGYAGVTNLCYYFNFTNCIFKTDGVYAGYAKLPSSSTCINCLSIDYSYLFGNLPTGQNINNKAADSYTEVFKTYNGGYTAGETFELTDEAKATYIGTDGTEIGMQGGVMPYTPTVGYPVITKLDAAAKTSKDGRLTIEIEVDGK